MPAGRRSPGRLRISPAARDSGASLGSALRADEARGKIKWEDFLTTTPLLFSLNKRIKKKNTRPFGNGRILTEEIEIILAASAFPH